MSTRARIAVTLEFDLGGGAWGPECTTGQVLKQARESALEAIRAGFVVDGLTIRSNLKHEARIVGEPKVTMILVEDGRS